MSTFSAFPRLKITHGLINQLIDAAVNLRTYESMFTQSTLNNITDYQSLQQQLLMLADTENINTLDITPERIATTLLDFKAYDLAFLKQTYSTLCETPSTAAARFRDKTIAFFDQSGAMLRHAISPIHIEKTLIQLFNQLHQQKMHPLLSSLLLYFELYYIFPFLRHNHMMAYLWCIATLSSHYPQVTQWPIAQLIKENETLFMEKAEKSDRANDASEWLEFMLKLIVLAVKKTPPIVQHTMANPAPVTPSTHAFAHSVYCVRILKCYKSKPDKRLNAKALMQLLRLKHRPTFAQNYLTPALQHGYLYAEYPDTPRHPLQRYMLTPKGQAFLEQFKRL